MEKLIKETFDYVRKELKNDYSGHDIDHINRVYKLGCEILEKVNCNHLIVKLALILHDIDDPKVTKINTSDCKKARIYLKKQKLEENLIKDICNIINKMSFSKNKEEKQKLSLEGMIVQDADRLDAIGAVGIARTFQYGGQHNRNMMNTIEHFDDKLLKLYDLLNTKEAKEVGKQRHEFLISFYNQFHKEVK